MQLDAARYHFSVAFLPCTGGLLSSDECRLREISQSWLSIMRGISAVPDRAMASTCHPWAGQLSHAPWRYFIFCQVFTFVLECFDHNTSEFLQFFWVSF